MKLKNAISHYALVSSRANNSDAPRLKLRTNSCRSRLRPNTAGHTTRQHEQKGRIQVDTLVLDWSAQLLCMTFTWKTQISCKQNRVRAKLYNCGACVCKSNVEIRIAGSFCRPQLMLPVLLYLTL